MPNVKTQKARGYLVMKVSEGWFVGTPHGDKLGPYLNGKFASDVARVHVFTSRRLGLDAHVFVRDDHSKVHKCVMIDRRDSPVPCNECTGMSPPQSPICPLHRETWPARR